jgi:RHS repeat-associated protein
VLETLPSGAKRLTLRDSAGTPLTTHGKTGTAVPVLEEVQLYSPAGRMAIWTAARGLHVIGTNLQRSVRFFYGADAKIVACLSYHAYGVLDVGASTPGALGAVTRWGYTGQEWIEALGLYDYNARLYDPVTARFLSPDPADETPSPYMYVGGDPVNAVDPDGTSIWHLAFFNGDIFFLSKRYRVILILRDSSKWDSAQIAGTLEALKSAWSHRRMRFLSFWKRNPFAFPKIERGGTIDPDYLDNYVLFGGKYPREKFWTGVHKDAFEFGFDDNSDMFGAPIRALKKKNLPKRFQPENVSLSTAKRRLNEKRLEDSDELWKSGDPVEKSTSFESSRSSSSLNPSPSSSPISSPRGPTLQPTWATVYLSPSASGFKELLKSGNYSHTQEGLLLGRLRL